MSCQQLIQEDPYVFTDTISNSTNFMQQNNSQTKYVPLYRQTIYSQQFRQHEPSIASSENLSPDPKSSSLKKSNDNFVTKSPSRTSPKLFKSNQIQPASLKGQYLVNSTSATTHHSITTSSASQQLTAEAPTNVQQSTSQLNHVSTTCDNDINKITGIKQGPLNGKSHTMTAVKNRTNARNVAAVVVELVSIAPEVQSNLFHVPPLSHHEGESFEKLSRDERIAQRKIQLRRRVQQFKGIQHYRTTERSRLRFSKTLKLLKQLDRAKEEIFRRPHRSCQFEGCTNEAISSTLHCIDHILMADREQHLVRQCCFLYGHGEQCRMPVFDVMATIAVCNEHQNAPAHQLIDPAKPKKTTQVSRKRISVKEPAKKMAKKKPVTVKPVIIHGQKKMIIHPHEIQKQPVKVTAIPKQDIVPEHHQFIHHNSGNLLASSQSSYSSIASASDDYLKQDLMTICENSYESSEDTGVGGLSENELMSHDVIGLDMESSDELTKVLSSLETNTLDDLLTEPLQTSRDDEEYLDRAIEEVSSVGLDQIAIGFEHLDGLGDMLEMMDDEEQRQMISAATNLISMSGMQGFLSSHDQDYSAMPSPMMS